MGRLHQIRRDSAMLHGCIATVVIPASYLMIIGFHPAEWWIYRMGVMGACASVFFGWILGHWFCPSEWRIPRIQAYFTTLLVSLLSTLFVGVSGGLSLYLFDGGGSYPNYFTSSLEVGISIGIVAFVYTMPAAIIFGVISNMIMKRRYSSTWQHTSNGSI
jgi:hypothetical protein